MKVNIWEKNHLMAKYYYQKINGVNSLLNNSITLTQKDFNPILDFKKNEFKFLAPSVFKFKKICNALL